MFYILHVKNYYSHPFIYLIDSLFVSISSSDIVNIVWRKHPGSTWRGRTAHTFTMQGKTETYFVFEFISSSFTCWWIHNNDKGQLHSRIFKHTHRPKFCSFRFYESSLLRKYDADCGHVEAISQETGETGHPGTGQYWQHHQCFDNTHTGEQFLLADQTSLRPQNVIYKRGRPVSRIPIRQYCCTFLLHWDTTEPSAVPWTSHSWPLPWLI